MILRTLQPELNKEGAKFSRVRNFSCPDPMKSFEIFFGFFLLFSFLQIARGLRKAYH